MNFADEEYVRLYTRDTPTWLMLGWQGQTLLCLALRKFDKAGVFEFGRRGPVPALCASTGLPREVVEAGLEAILGEEVWQQTDRALMWPQYVEAQNCRRSDRLRKRDERRRARGGHPESPGVPTVGPEVTPSTPDAQESDSATVPPECVRPDTEKVTEVPPGHAASHESQRVTPCLASPSPLPLPCLPPNPPTGASEDLQTRAGAYLRDEQGERLRHQPAETWPEVRQVLDAFRAAWPKAPAPVIRGGLRDSRLRAVLERLSEGYAPAELARAVKASASDEHYQRHASCQTLSTILGDPARVDRWLAAEPDAPRRDTPEEARRRAANQRRLAKAAAEDEARKRQLEAEGAELRRQHGSPEGAAAVAAAVRMVATAMQERT